MQDLLTKNLGLKFFSLALAVAIWLTVQGLQKQARPVGRTWGPWETRTLTNVPVLVVSAAADVREIKVQPNGVNVTVGGSPQMLAGLLEKEIEARVDLTDIESARS